MTIRKIGKKMIAFCLSLMVCLCSFLLEPLSVLAQDSAETEPGFKVRGASIRFLNDNIEVDGIRFAVAIKEDIFKTLSADQKANYRLLVMPTALVDGRLEKEEIYSYRSGQKSVTTKAVDAEVNWSSVSYQDGYAVTHVYLYGIGKSFYTTGLTARMYYQDEDGIVHYSEELKRSYAEVAGFALNDVSDSKGGNYQQEAGSNFSPYTKVQRNALLGVKYEKTGSWDYDGEILSTEGAEQTDQNTTIHPLILEREEKISSSNAVIETSFKIGVSDESALEGQPDGTDSQIKGFVFGYDDNTSSYMILDFRYRSNVAGTNGSKVSNPGWYPYLRVNNGNNGGWSGTVIGKGSPLATGVYDFRITIDNNGAATQVKVEYKTKGDSDSSYQTMITTDGNLDWSSQRLQFTGTKVGFISSMKNQTLEFDSEIKVYNETATAVDSGLEKTDGDTTVEEIDVSLEETGRYSNPITDEQQPYRAGSVETQKLAGNTNAIEDISMAGDPYILRYNGKFYLYVSTDEWYSSYRCWESLDLIHYTFLGEYYLLDKNGNRYENDTADKQEDNALECPWAPEVHYWNGKFYMYTSPHASGHVVLESTSGEPYGDYKVVTESFDEGIDGSFFIDDNEEKWFVRAYRYTDDNNTSISIPAAIKAKTMTALDITWLESLLKTDKHIRLSKTGITGRHVEGPFVFKRNGIYYMVATGEDVAYPGYRLNYAYNNTGSVAGEANWSLEKEPNLIISTEGEYQSYGHGAVTIGPDLDSYWFVYHMARESKMNSRMNGISRIEFSGTRMSVMGQDQEVLKPSAPDFYTSYFTELSNVCSGGKDTGITREAGYCSYTDERTKAGEGLHSVSSAGTTQLLSGREKSDGTVELIKTGSRFTAEYNFKDVATDGTFKCLFGGGYLTINGTTIQLYKGSQKLAEADMLVNGETGWDWSAYHDIIVAYGDGRITVTIDGCQKIDLTDVTGLGNGAIGYEGASGTQIGGAVFSNQAFGSSDREVAKNVEGTFYASNYYKAKDGESASVLSHGSSNYIVEDAETPVTYTSSFDGQEHSYYLYKDATAFTLAEGDRAVYKIDVAENGTYSFAALFAAASDGSVIKVQIDEETPQCYIVKTNGGSVFQKRVVDKMYLEKGLHTITIKSVTRDFTAIEYEMNKVSTASVKYSNSLSSTNTNGEYFKNWTDGENKLTEWTIQDGAHYASADKRNIVRFGNTDMTDYKVRVDLKTNAVNGQNNAGIILRLTNPSLSTVMDGFTKPSQVYGSGMGYYVCLNEEGVSIQRFDYNEVTVACYKATLNADTYYTLEAECVGETLTVWLNGKQILTYTDPYSFACGAAAIYSNEAESYYKNLEIRTACGYSTSDYVTDKDTEYTLVSGAFKKTANGVQVAAADSILLDNTVNIKGLDMYAVNTAYTILPDTSQAIKGIVFNYDEVDGSYLVLDYRYVNEAYRLYVRHFDGTKWTENVWDCGVELTANAQYEFNISAVNHADSVTVGIDYRTGTNSFKQVSKNFPVVMTGRKAGYISTAANEIQFVRLADVNHAEIGIGWPDNWSDALGSSKLP